jgi:hypothetical protein
MAQGHLVTVYLKNPNGPLVTGAGDALRWGPL